MALYRVKGDFNFFRISSCGTFRGLPGRALRAPPCNAPCAGAGAASPDEDEEELEGLLESLSSSDAVAGTPVLTSLKGGRQCFGHNCKAWVPHPTRGTFKSRRPLRIELSWSLRPAIKSFVLRPAALRASRKSSQYFSPVLGASATLTAKHTLRC